MAESKKNKLVKFLDEKAFDPVLEANAEDFPKTKRDKLENVQRKTEVEKERFHNYRSAAEVVKMYRDDLSSENAKPVNRDLKALGLPCLPDLKDEFEAKAKELGVET